MSRIDDLVAQYCPDGVEFKKLGDVCKIKTGPNVNKQLIASNPGKFPVINSGREPLGFIDQWNTEDDPIGIASRGSVGLITWSEGRYYRGNLNYSCTVIDKTAVSVRYLFFILHYMQAEIQSLATHDGIPALNKSNLETLGIPVPPLEVQEEIVKILDTFTELGAELEVELEARQQQYNHCRAVLLNFDDDVFKILDDVCNIASGGTPSKLKKEFWENGDIPWLKSESCNNKSVYSANNFITDLGLKKSSAKLLEKDTTLMALVGATIFKTAYLEFKSTANQNIASIKSKDNEILLDKFVFYYLTNLYSQLKSKMRNYSMLNLTTLRQFKIPVPPLKEQQRIVAILDKFDTLVNDISNGLPAEINLRRQQYQHYRHQLLNFRKT